MLLRALVVGGAVFIAACSSSASTPPECVDNEGAALKTCAKANTIGGVDVSSYEGTVDFDKLKSAGRAFVFVRSSDGLQHPDETFATNWNGAKSAGLIRGVYQYFRASEDPTAEADDMIAKITAAGGIGVGDLPPVLDLETADGESASVVVAKAQTWLARVKAKMGVAPIVYTAAFMSDTIGTSFAGFTLWVANYGVTCPTMPAGWTNWQFWQDADNGKVDGISGAVDTDTFNGTITELQALTIQPAGSLPPSNATVPGSLLPTGNGTQTTTGAPLDPCASH